MRPLRRLPGRPGIKLRDALTGNEKGIISRDAQPLALPRADGKQICFKDQNLVIADGLLFALTKNDELVMAEASPERYRELGRVPLNIKLGRPQQPTIANGRLYIRGDSFVICYQIAGSGSAEAARP